MVKTVLYLVPLKRIFFNKRQTDSNIYPAGKMNENTGSDEADDCVDCSGGFYCDSTGIAVPTKECDAGYFCPPGLWYNFITQT